ncbi:RimJ/RimL family protein N-acetyltransferase [Bradyrhizobium japonicum]
MLQDFSSTTLREARPSVVATERLTLRRPTLADVRTIARLANDRRVAENTRRLPHPYSQDDAIEFIRATAEIGSETVFLIEHDSGPVGMVGIDCSKPDNAELGYWLGVEHWGQGFATEAARGAIDFFFEEFEDDHLHAGARVTNPRLAQGAGEVRLPVERRPAAPLPGAGLVHARRLLPPVARGVGVAEELEQRKTGEVGRRPRHNRHCRPGARRSREPGTHNPREKCEAKRPLRAVVKPLPVGMGPGLALCAPREDSVRVATPADLPRCLGAPDRAHASRYRTRRR